MRTFEAVMCRKIPKQFSFMTNDDDDCCCCCEDGGCRSGQWLFNAYLNPLFGTSPYIGKVKYDRRLVAVGHCCH